MRTDPKRVMAAVFTLIVVFFLLSACTLPSRTTQLAPAGSTPDTVYTQAVETVVAQLTQAAGPAVTPTPEVMQPAPTQVPPTSAPPTNVPPAATATQVPPTATLPPPTATLAPSASAEPPAATATLASSDPKLNLGTPDFQDTFTSDQNWSFSKDEHSQMGVKNGSLEMIAFNADRFDSWALTWPRLNNFYAEMTAKSGTCSGLDRYGLIVRSNVDADRGYLFAISCDGHYSFRLWDGKKYTRLVDWTASSDIIKGANQTNRVGIKVEGSTFSLYVNGILLDKVTDKTYASGYAGVLIASAETKNYTVNVSELDYWNLP